LVALNRILAAAGAAANTARRPHHAGYHFLRGYMTSALAREQRCPDPVVRRHYGLPRVLEVAKAALGLGPRYVSKAAHAHAQGADQ
jgi:hypothetical protein